MVLEFFLDFVQLLESKLILLWTKVFFIFTKKQNVQHWVLHRDQDVIVQMVAGPVDGD